MTDSDTLKPAAMTSPAEDQLLDYQSFNIFALAGLIFGVLSAASLIDHLFWLIPAAGTLMSLYALWRIARSDRSQVGRPLAVMGLCLSLFFLLAAPAAEMARRQYIRAESRAFADRWFEYLRHGDAAAVYAMTLSYHSRGGDADFDRVAIVQDKGLTHYFRQNQLVDSLLDRRDNATVEYVSTPVQYFRSGRDVVSHEYQMRLSKQDIAEPIDVVLERDKDVGTGTWSWRIARISLRPSGE